MLNLDFCSKDNFKTLTYEFLDLKQKLTSAFGATIFSIPHSFYKIVKRPFIQL